MQSYKPTHHILWTYAHGSEHVEGYDNAEFTEAFTQNHREQLMAGNTVQLGGGVKVTHMTAAARKARDTKPAPTFDGEEGANPGFLAMINDRGATDWLTCVDTAQEAEDAIRNHMIREHDKSEMVGWVVKVETFIHHPDA